MIKNVCGQSGDRALKLTVSQECINEVNRSFAFDTDSQKLKVDQNFFGWSWPKMVWLVCSQDSKIECISKMD